MAKILDGGLQRGATKPAAQTPTGGVRDSADHRAPTSSAGTAAPPFGDAAKPCCDVTPAAPVVELSEIEGRVCQMDCAINIAIEMSKQLLNKQISAAAGYAGAIMIHGIARLNENRMQMDD